MDPNGETAHFHRDCWKPARPFIHRGHVQAAGVAAREMGGLSLADALSLCELLWRTNPAR